MGFKLKYEDDMFTPRVSCDICEEEKELSDLNYEHNLECTEACIICKECSSRKASKHDLWMPMNAFVGGVMHNSKYDRKEANDYFDLSVKMRG